MTVSAKLSKDGKTLIVQVPMTFRKRGGRKLIVVPDGASWAPPRAHVDGPMVRAFARAHRWKRLTARPPPPTAPRARLKRSGGSSYGACSRGANTLSVAACAAGSSGSPATLNPAAGQASTEPVAQSSSWNWATASFTLGLFAVAATILAL